MKWIDNGSFAASETTSLKTVSCIEYVECGVSVVSGYCSSGRTASVEAFSPKTSAKLR